MTTEMSKRMKIRDVFCSANAHSAPFEIKITDMRTKTNNNNVIYYFIL